MNSSEFFALLLASVVLLNALATLLMVDPRLFRGLRERLRELSPYLVFLGAVLVLNKIAREVGPELSWIVDWNITGLIYELEGNFVPLVQSVASPVLTTYFSTVYIVGYAFLLTFPFIAYAALSDLKYVKGTIVAFGLNYALGLVGYILFISYGPRNLIPDLVDPLLYSTYPRTQIVTSQVNANTNVFPSLHTSLSVTVALLAWRSRETYPLWTVIAIPLAASIIISTVYLGIHWGTDVVAGIVLGVGSLLAADKILEREKLTRLLNDD